MRPSIKHGDVDVAKIVGIAPAEGWVAVYSIGDEKPLLFWLLIEGGDLVGLVGEDPRGRTLMGEVRAADKLLNFQNYLRKV